MHKKLLEDFASSLKYIRRICNYIYGSFIFTYCHLVCSYVITNVFYDTFILKIWASMFEILAKFVAAACIELDVLLNL